MHAKIDLKGCNFLDPEECRLLIGGAVQNNLSTIMPIQLPQKNEFSILQKGINQQIAVNRNYQSAFNLWFSLNNYSLFPKDIHTCILAIFPLIFPIKVFKVKLLHLESAKLKLFFKEHAKKDAVKDTIMKESRDQLLEMLSAPEGKSRMEIVQNWKKESCLSALSKNKTIWATKSIEILEVEMSKPLVSYVL